MIVHLKKDLIRTCFVFMYTYVLHDKNLEILFFVTMLRSIHIFFYLIIFSQSGHFFLTFACIILILFHSSKVNRTIRYSLILNISKHNFAKRLSDHFWPGNWMDSDLEILIFLLTVFFKKCVLSCHIFQKLKTEKLRFECQQCQEWKYVKICN